MRKLRKGELVYLKNVGFPFDQSGHSWEGASCVVVDPEVGEDKRFVRVAPLLPMRAENGQFMRDCLFHPETVIRESRPWLRKNLKQILALRKKLVEFSELAQELTICP
jgi:hypothetical protein